MGDREQFATWAAEAAAAVGTAVHYETYWRYNPSVVAARFRLDNGLTLVLMPDRRAPVFAYQTWFKVGSRDEDPACTGLAHLFEHLMFKGTTQHAAGQLDREMELRGSETNAATWVDWTFYYEALATRGDNLETVIQFESDRMTGLVLDESTFRSELEVVKNERRMAVEDSVGGLLAERLFAEAFTTHPYRWPTLGAMAHLEAASLDELRAFYRSFYAPNNAVVVLVGDVQPAAALTALARGYGNIAAQPVSRRPRPAEPPQSAPRYSCVERPIVAPQLAIGYHAPAELAPGFAALEILSEVLVSGDSGRLYRRLVINEELATDVGAFLAPFAEPGLYEVSVTARPGIDPQRIVAVVQEELDGLAAGITPRELNKAQNGLELAFVDSLKDAEGCAEALGHYETNFGDFSQAFRSVERWRQVQPRELQHAAQTVLCAANRTAVAVVPPGASR